MDARIGRAGIESEIRHRLFTVFARVFLMLKLAIRYSACVAIFRSTSFVLLQTLLHFFVKGHSLLVIEVNLVRIVWISIISRIEEVP